MRLPLSFPLPCSLARRAWAGPPFVTDDTDTPDKGHFEINLAAQYTRFVGGSVGNAPSLEMKYGVLSNGILHKLTGCAQTSNRADVAELPNRRGPQGTPRKPRFRKRLDLYRRDLCPSTRRRLHDQVAAPRRGSIFPHQGERTQPRSIRAMPVRPLLQYQSCRTASEPPVAHHDRLGYPQLLAGVVAGRPSGKCEILRS